jgi:hypothetical protein
VGVRGLWPCAVRPGPASQVVFLQEVCLQAVCLQAVCLQEVCLQEAVWCAAHACAGGRMCCSLPRPLVHVGWCCGGQLQLLCNTRSKQEETCCAWHMVCGVWRVV